MKKTFAILVLALAIIAALYFGRPRPIVVQVIPVTRGDLEIELVEDGITRVRERYVVTAPITGTLRRVELRAGDPVKKGQIIARLNWFQEWRITAPVSGYVLRVLQESEGDIEKGRPILEVGDPSDLEIVLDVLTEKATLVNAGAPVIIDKWGGPNPLHGEVSRIEPSAFNKISSLGVEEQRTNVIVQILEPRALWKNLGDNFHLEGRILYDHKKNILKVPRSALFRSGSSWAVYRVENNKAHITPIEIGVQGTDEAQVLEGPLHEGDLVISYPSQEIVDGSRIQAEQK